MNNWAEGIMIISDFDGTFTVPKSFHDETRYVTLVRDNIDAVRDFTSHGGLFTFCTGRIRFDEIFPDYLTVVNAPVGYAQGAIVRDLDDRVLRINYFDSEIADDIEKIIKLSIDMQDVIYDRHFDNEGRTIKMVYVGDEKTTDEIERIVSCKYSDSILHFKTNPSIVEFMDLKSKKSDAAKFIIDYCKKDNKIIETFGIGDYDNDVSLADCCDHFFCPANSTEAVKRRAKDNIVCDARYGAVAELIGLIKKQRGVK